MDKTDDWTTFVRDKLLYQNIIDGILLFSLNLDLVHTHGSLQDIKTDQLLQFKAVFDALHDESKLTKTLINGFHLDINTKLTKFVVRKCTQHSVYAVSKGNQVGLIVVNLPFGILVTSHTYPITSAIAAQHVEDVCVLLRS